MRKILPTILIALILVNLFAPFSVGRDANNAPVLTKSVAEAKEMTIGVTRPSATDSSFDLTFTMARKESDNHGLFYIVTDTKGTTLSPALLDLVKSEIAQSALVSESAVFVVKSSQKRVGGARISNDLLTSGTTQGDFLVNTITETVTGLSADTTYWVSAWGFNGNAGALAMDSFLDSPVKTAAAGKTETANVTVGNLKTSDDPMPDCVFAHIRDGTFTGCLAQAVYYVLFVPSSYLFALTGIFFDNTFNYSIKDSSYTTSFVTEGWGVVRDFVNMFFIFVLLYVAFATILSLHGFKTKEMIVNVVIIGLFINFSLFTTKIIIDTSNILARVFYNNASIKTSKEVGGAETVLGRGPNGELSLSGAIVSKVDPQNLIINSNHVTVDDPGKSGGEASLSAGKFLLITFLAIAVNVVGIIAFISIGMIFVARVIGLWIAMILVPLAFFSYTVPRMKSIDVIGWEKWWPETIKLAFLAPVFMFFLYLILKFLTVIDIVAINHESSGPEFVIGIMIPFVFIMVLLLKAKDIAKNMSGTLGKSITGGVAMVGGLALGAATGGAALLGRSTVGRLAANLDKRDGLNNLAAGKNRDGTVMKDTWSNRLRQRAAIAAKKTTTAGSKGSFDFRQTGAGNAFSKETGMNLNKGTNFVGLDTKKTVGGFMGAQQRKIEADEKFGKTLGFDHHKDQDLSDNIAARKDEILEEETKRDNLKAKAKEYSVGSDEHTEYTRQSGIAAQNVIALNTGGEIRDVLHGDVLRTVAKGDALKTMEKDKERVQTGRQTEFSLSRNRKSGKIFEIDTNEYTQGTATAFRDAQGNIKKIGHSTYKFSKDVGEAFNVGIADVLKGMAGGALVAGPLGALGGGVAALVRHAVINYDPVAAAKVGAAHNHKEDFKDTYKAPSAPAAEHHEEHAAPAGGDDTHAHGH